MDNVRGASPRRSRKGRRSGIDLRVPVTATAALGLVGVLALGATAAPATAAVELEEGLVAEYLFEETTGETVHNTADGDAAPGDPLDAVIRNYADTQRAGAGTLRFTGGAKSSTGNWVELPDDLLADASSATISIDVLADPTMLNANHFLWNIGSDSTQQYWFATTRGPRTSITTTGASGERTGTGYAMTANRWHSLTAVLDADTDTITLFTDGQRSGVGKTTATPADIAQTLNTIGRAPYNDQLFRGAVGAFRVYDRALGDDDIIALSELDAAAHTAELRAAADVKLAALDLGDTAAVTSDLDLFPLREISWSSSDPSVLANDGTLTRPGIGSPDATVTLTATAAARGVSATAPRTFSVTVPALTPADAAADRDALHLPDVVQGNVSLPDRGAAGTPITWESSDPSVISDTPVGAAAAGVVTRPAWGEDDVEVTLTATIGQGPDALTRELPVTVAAAPRPAADSRYLFAYFTADTLVGEQISMATSQGNSAMSWDVLNDGNPVLSSTEGTRGLRDPFIMRSAEGDRFFLIATDLSIGSGTSWDSALDFGSTHLEIWESTDLRTWSEQRHVSVSGPFASMTWAPEAYWDDEAGEYVVYWSSRLYLDATRPYDKARTPNHTYSKVMYATTRDFVTFSDAKVWQDAGDRIDTTMIEDDGMFYRFTKEVTGCVDITQESSPSMRALTVPGEHAWVTDASCISKNARGTTRTTEGPTIFRANAGDTSLPEGVDEGFYLFVDDFTGSGYLPLFTESLADPQWRTVAGSLPRSRHGSVMPITLNQWESVRGEELSQVGTSTRLTGVADGDVLAAGDTLTAVVTAQDGGAVAGDVVFTVGEQTFTASLERSGTDHVARVVLDDTVAAGSAVGVSASYGGFDVLAGSASQAVTVTIDGAHGEPEVSAVVGVRCVVGRTVQVVTLTNDDDVPVAVGATSPYGARETASLAPGRSVSYAFTTRAVGIAAGTVEVSAEATRDGDVVPGALSVAYGASSCA